MTDFAQKIRLYKVKLDLSNKDLAERTGLPVTTISRICSGSTKNPTLNTVKLLAKALDCSVEELMDYTDGVAPYFLDETTATLAQELKKNEKLKLLFDTTRVMPPEKLNNLINLVSNSVSMDALLEKSTELKLLHEFAMELSSDEIRTIIDMIKIIKRNKPKEGQGK